jgi:hypothetical protein
VSPIKKRVKPSNDAVLIVTKEGGWVVWMPEAIRQVVSNGSKYADIAELAQTESGVQLLDEHRGSGG